MKNKIHLDSSMLIEIIKNQPKKDKCFSLVWNSGEAYVLKIATPALGEIVKAVLNHKDPKGIKYLFEILEKQVLPKVELFTPTFDSILLMNSIREKDNYLKCMDALIYSCAISDSADIFYTLNIRDFKTLRDKNPFKTKIKILI